MNKILKNKIFKILTIIILIIIILFSILLYTIKRQDKAYVMYKDFYNELENGNIYSVVIEDNQVTFIKFGNKKIFYTDNPEYDGFKENLLLHGVVVKEDSSIEKIELIFNIMFYLFFFGAISFAIYKVLEMSEKNFKIVKHTNVKFENIAGMERIKKRYDKDCRDTKKSG